MPNPNFLLTTQEEEVITEEIHNRAEFLGKLLRELPEFKTFIEAGRKINENEEAMHLYGQLQEHITNLQRGLGDFDEHQRMIKTLSEQFHNLPITQSYQEATTKTQLVFSEVDKKISEIVGVSFGKNAKKSCCG